MNPLIVMGMGRSGTRYFSDILSSHKDILLHGEIPHSAMAKFFLLLETLDKEHSRDRIRSRKWNEKKGKFILDSFGSMAMGGERDKKGHIYVGHKTPRSEMFFDSYETHFFSAGYRPVYFYCIRNPFDVWASYKMMPWNAFDNVDIFIEMYETSYRRYIRARRTAGDRIHILNLDLYKKDRRPEAFLRKRLFSRLNIDTTDDFLSSLLEKKNTNSSTNFIGKAPEKNSLEEEQRILSDKKISAIIDEHFPWLGGRSKHRF